MSTGLFMEKKKEKSVPPAKPGGHLTKLTKITLLLFDAAQPADS